jgi:DNA invertase Pin-like site-specific DNA recombinase
MSSLLQNEKSPEDQTRVCKKRAAADGAVIPDENVFIDRAVSGTKPDRDGLTRLKEAARAKRFSVLYFEDLSRLGRESTELMRLLKELVHAGIRIVSLNEGIDSNIDSWQLLATITSLQHETFIRDLAQRIRRGKAGAVLEGLSVGDWCFGYGSEPIPGSEKNRRGRDCRPRKRVVIDEATARWVVQIFVWFAIEHRSMQWIARELTRLNVPKDHRATTPGWHHQYVRRVLTNEKLIGKWKWGLRRNKRHPLTGKIKQEAVPDKDVIVREREDLRIVPQELWDAAQARLRELKKIYPGPNGGVGQKGASYVDSYPKTEFGGLVICAACGGRFQTAGAFAKYLACGARHFNRCTVRTHAPRKLLRSLLTDQLKRHVTSTKNMLDTILEAVHRHLAAAESSVPKKIQSRKLERSGVERKIGNLYDLARESGTNLQDLGRRIAELERQQGEYDAELRQLEEQLVDPSAVPTRAWLLQQLEALEAWVGEDPRELALVFRAYTGGRIEMENVIPPGKKRGYFRAHFKGNVVNVIADRALRSAGENGSDECKSVRLLQRACRNASFTCIAAIDVKPASRAEQLSVEVRQLRRRGLSWKAIQRRLRCGQQTVMRAAVPGEREAAV